MNRPPIEMLATKPMMIMLMQGGIVSAITAVQASRPAASFGSWRVRRTAGMTMPPTAAMSASLEPETPEKNAVAVIVIRPRPPRTRPNMRSSSSIRRDDMPFDFHQQAGEDEERNREQHEVVDAGHHLLRIDEHRQRRVGEEVEQRGESKHEADRHAERERAEKADAEQRAVADRVAGHEPVPGVDGERQRDAAGQAGDDDAARRVERVGDARRAS